MRFVQLQAGARGQKRSSLSSSNHLLSDDFIKSQQTHLLDFILLQRCKKRQIWQMYLCYSFQGGANFWTMYAWIQTGSVTTALSGL